MSKNNEVDIEGDKLLADAAKEVWKNGFTYGMAAGRKRQLSDRFYTGLAGISIGINLVLVLAVIFPWWLAFFIGSLISLVVADLVIKVANETEKLLCTVSYSYGQYRLKKRADKLDELESEQKEKDNVDDGNSGNSSFGSGD